MKKQICIAVICSLVCFTVRIWAGVDEDASGASDNLDGYLEDSPASSQTILRYRTREEAREAGLERALTEWFSLSTLFETEVLHYRSVRSDGTDDTSIENSLSLQLGWKAEISDIISLESVVEYDSDEDRFKTEEIFLTMEYEPWELTLGRQFTPFGSYFSRFVSGPVLEFGETQADKAVALTYGPSDELDLMLMVYRGIASELDEKQNEWNWSFGFEFWPLRDLSLGLSYQADLADSDERLLIDWNDQYTDQVAGISGYLFYVNGEYEASIEYLSALSPFKEFDRAQDKPRAWNLEVSRYFSRRHIEVALRIEGSRELSEAPTQRYGICLTNYVDTHASLTLEYLHGDYSNRAIFSEQEERLDQDDYFGAKVSIGL